MNTSITNCWKKSLNSGQDFPLPKSLTSCLSFPSAKSKNDYSRTTTDSSSNELINKLTNFSRRSIKSFHLLCDKCKEAFIQLNFKTRKRACALK